MEKGKPFPLLVWLETGVATVEASVEVSQETKNRTTT